MLLQRLIHKTNLIFTIASVNKKDRRAKKADIVVEQVKQILQKNDQRLILMAR